MVRGPSSTPLSSNNRPQKLRKLNLTRSQKKIAGYLRYPLLALFAYEIGIGLSDASAQTLTDSATEAPTSFRTRNPNRGTDSAAQNLRPSPGIQVNESGSVQTLSARGGKSSDVAVTLEDIPLNFPSEGFFNLGTLSFYGLEDSLVLRGGYAPYSTSPSQQLRLRLPQSPRPQLTARVDSLGGKAFYQSLPMASFSLEHSPQDFWVHDGKLHKLRRQNSSLRVNLRAWHRFESGQVWAQVLYLHQEVPISLDPEDPDERTPASEVETFSPTVAAQKKLGPWELSAWGSLQTIEQFSQGSKSSNESATLGQRLQRFDKLHPKLGVHNRSEFQQSTYNRDDLDRKNRYLFSHSLAFHITPTEKNLVHPRIRWEVLSDLDEKFSIHPGIGGRHHLLPSAAILWNLQWIQRAPSLYDRYYESSFTTANPELRRQSSMQGDMGYEAEPGRRVQFSQAFFFDRTSDLIEYNFATNQSENSGVSLTTGVENEISAELNESLSLEAQYTFTNSHQGSQTRRYIAKHRGWIQPTYQARTEVVLGLPFYARSSMKGFSRNLGPQADLGAFIRAHFHRFELEIRAHNLLGWRREEVEGFPLSQKPWIQLGLTAKL